MLLSYDYKQAKLYIHLFITVHVTENFIITLCGQLQVYMQQTKATVTSHNTSNEL